MTRAHRLPTFTLAKEDLDEGCIVYHFIIDAAVRTCALVTRRDTSCQGGKKNKKNNSDSSW